MQQQKIVPLFLLSLPSFRLIYIHRLPNNHQITNFLLHICFSRASCGLFLPKYLPPKQTKKKKLFTIFVCLVLLLSSPLLSNSPRWCRSSCPSPSAPGWRQRSPGRCRAATSASPSPPRRAAPCWGASASPPPARCGWGPVFMLYLCMAHMYIHTRIAFLFQKMNVRKAENTYIRMEGTQPDDQSSMKRPTSK